MQNNFYTFIFHLHAKKLAIKQFFNHEIRLVSQMSFIIIKNHINIKKSDRFDNEKSSNFINR